MMNILPDVSFQGDVTISAILGILTFVFLFRYASIATLKRGKFWFWLGVGAVILGGAITAGVYTLSFQRGLIGTYYDAPNLSGNPVQSLRYFDTPGQRADRFIDFDPNDFNNRYPFSGSSFSVKWEGYIYLPTTMSAIEVEGNFSSTLSIDDILVQRPSSAMDVGTPGVRNFLGRGWSFDEGKKHGETTTTFVWSSQAYSDIYLGLDEIAEYRLNFRALSYQYPGAPEQEVTVAVNGVVLETVTFPQKWEWKTYTVTVPRAVIQQAGPGALWIRFSYSNPVRPADVVEQSSDRRRVAIALDAVSIENSSEKAQSPGNAHWQQEFSPGIHRISLKAYSNGNDPFIRLVWKGNEHSQISRIPEDYLFPPDSDPARIKEMLGRARAALGLSIAYKWGVVVLLAGLLVYSLLPELRDFRWKRLLNRHTLLLIGILVFAFLVRLFFILEMRSLDRSFYILPDGTDHLSYWFFARAFFRGHWPFLTHESFFQAPLISFYFILCSMLFGENLFVIRIVTAFLSTCSLMFVFSITHQTFNKTVAYIAMALCACNGVLIFYDTSLVLAPLIVFLNLASLWLMYRLRAKLSWRTTILLGIVIGLTGLARANIVLLMPFLFLWMLFEFPGPRWQRMLHYGGIGVVAILVILPVSLRNYYAEDGRHWVWTNSNGGVTFWIGNNSSSNGMFGYSDKLLQETRQRMKKEGTSYRDEVLTYIKEHTKDYASLEYDKFKKFWRGFEIGNNIPYYIFRNSSKILRLPWVNFVLLGPLSIVGLLLAFKRWKDAFILYGFSVVQLMTTLLFFALARYRLPAVPVFSMFAAYTLWLIIQSCRQQKWLGCLLIITSVMILYTLINYPYAASEYQEHYGEVMPWWRTLRYWDIFHIP